MTTLLLIIGACTVAAWITDCIVYLDTPRRAKK